MNTLGLRRLGLRARRLVRAKLGPRTKTYFHHRVAQYRSIWAHAADACGASLVDVAPDLWRAERDGLHVYLRNHEVQLDDPVTLIMAGRKPLMHRLLGDAGLAVPEHRVFTLEDLEPALDFLGSHPSGVVVKPANGSAAGDGVSTHVRTGREVERAALLASLYDREILVEAMVAGESCRALVVGGRLLHAVCRRGPRVRGDGRATVRELMAGLNGARRSTGAREVAVDRDCRFTLGWQGLGPDEVVPPGREVLVKAVETPEGGDREIRTVYNATVTDDLCPSIRDTAEVAARVLGSDFTGVDFITTDVTRPLHETGGCINEVNTTPALHHHYDADREVFPRVAVDVLELAFTRQRQRTPAHGSMV